VCVVIFTQSARVLQQRDQGQSRHNSRYSHSAGYRRLSTSARLAQTPFWVCHPCSCSCGAAARRADGDGRSTGRESLTDRSGLGGRPSHGRAAPSC
jgi:hypothetical protein